MYQLWEIKRKMCQGIYTKFIIFYKFLVHSEK